MFKFISSFFLFLLLSTISQAQILNVEKFQSKLNDSTKWINQIGLKGDITQTENTVYEFKERSFTAYRPGSNQYLLLSEFKGVVVEGDNVISNGYVHLRSSFNFKEKVSYELYFQEQFDAIRGLKRRDVQGFNFRFDLINSKRVSVDIATGFMHEFEWWFKVQKQSRNLIKSNTSLLLAFPISEQFTFRGTGYYQFVPNRPAIPRIIWDGNLSWNLTSHVQIAISSNIFYDAEPIVNIDPWVNNLSFELVINW